jgi:proline racemase
MAQKRDWLSRHGDRFRGALVLEPRGHLDMVAAMLTDPVTPGADAGLLFMDANGYPAMSGHGVIASATVAIERGLIQPGGGAASAASPPPGESGGLRRLVFDTPAGPVIARARLEERGGSTRVDSVAFANVPAFVHTAAHPVKLGHRELRVDIAYGGIFHALVDTEAVGIPLDARKLPEFRRLASDILASLNSGHRVAHPAEAWLTGVGAVVFTGPPQDPEAHLRNVTIAGESADRSPGGTGTSAVMAVLDAMGLLPQDQPFVNEGLSGSLFRAQASRRTLVGDYAAVVTEIEGHAWITGEHTFLVDEDDPLRDGLQEKLDRPAKAGPTMP